MKDHGIREIKDAMNRDILTALDEAGIGIASATYDIVGFPTVRFEKEFRSSRTPPNELASP